MPDKQSSGSKHVTMDYKQVRIHRTIARSLLEKGDADRAITHVKLAADAGCDKSKKFMECARTQGVLCFQTLGM